MYIKRRYNIFFVLLVLFVGNGSVPADEKEEVLLFKRDPLQFVKIYPGADIITISFAYDSDRGPDNYTLLFGIRIGDFLNDFLKLEKEDIQEKVSDYYSWGEIKQHGIRDDCYEGLIWNEAKGAWASTKLEIGTKLYLFYERGSTIVIAVTNDQYIPYLIMTSEYALWFLE